MTATWFVALTALLAAAVVAGAWRFLSRRSFVVVLIGLPAWLAWVGTLSAAGVIRDVSLRPPGIVYVFAPVLLFMMLFAVRSRAGLAVALRIPTGLLIGAQCFRVGVELGLHRLGEERLVPRLMTYDGGNVDIFVGVSAPLVAWLLVTGRIGRGPALAWNVVGLLALANVAARAVLSAPGPLNVLHTEVPNVAVGLFPFTYLAGFFAPMAVLLHVLCIRALRAGRLPAGIPSRPTP
jgi:hypothetical protein